MRKATDELDRYFLEMRWRCLSLAADLDRIQRCTGGDTLITADPRLSQLRQAVQELMSAKIDRAERVQMIFSDTTPPPR